MTSTTPIDRPWRVVSTIELDAPPDDVWAVVGGFFTIHKWHPDIALVEIGENQTSIPELRRILTFPGQPKTIEQLVYMDNKNRQYGYKWFSGKWGEEVKNYQAEIKVIELVVDKTCMVHWSSTFVYHEDALTQFYQNGFDSLQRMFPPASNK